MGGLLLTSSGLVVVVGGIASVPRRDHATGGVWSLPSLSAPRTIPCLCSFPLLLLLLSFHTVFRCVLAFPIGVVVVLCCSVGAR